MATVDMNGRTYNVKRHRVHGRYVNVKIEDVTPGMRLDMGTFLARIPGMWGGEVNPRTWEIKLDDGNVSYTETRSTDDHNVIVRVWL